MFAHLQRASLVSTSLNCRVRTLASKSTLSEWIMQSQTSTLMIFSLLFVHFNRWKSWGSENVGNFSRDDVRIRYEWNSTYRFSICKSMRPRVRPTKLPSCLALFGRYTKFATAVYTYGQKYSNYGTYISGGPSDVLLRHMYSLYTRIKRVVGLSLPLPFSKLTRLVHTHTHTCEQHFPVPLRWVCVQ